MFTGRKQGSQTPRSLSQHGLIRAALLSDTHGVIDARVAAAVSECDIAVHAGDVGGAFVLTSLRPRLGIVVAIRGNNDTPNKWPSHDHGHLDLLPQGAKLNLPGGVLAIVHGDRHRPAKRRHWMMRREFPNMRAVLYGHTHRMVIDDAAIPWVLNPGAAGKARTYGGPSCLILIASDKRWEVVAYRFGGHGQIMRGLTIVDPFRGAS